MALELEDEHRLIMLERTLAEIKSLFRSPGTPGLLRVLVQLKTLPGATITVASGASGGVVLETLESAMAHSFYFGSVRAADGQAGLIEGPGGLHAPAAGDSANDAVVQWGYAVAALPGAKTQVGLVINNHSLVSRTLAYKVYRFAGLS